MEPENIGIGRIIESVHRRPIKWARSVIAPMVLKLLAKETRQQSEGKPASIKEAVLTADHHPTEAQISKVTTIVVQILERHAAGETLSQCADHDSVSLVSRACMHLLGDWLHKKGQIELAHYIHDTQYNHSLFNQPARLELLEHGIIGENRLWREKDEKEELQFWAGYETQHRYPGKKTTRERNIILALQKEEGDKKFNIKPILRGDKVYTFDENLIALIDKTLTVYGKPHSNKQGEFACDSWGEFACDFGVKKISYFQTKNGWHLYRIKPEDASGNEDSEEIGATICTHSENPQLSFMAHSRRYMIHGNPFVADTYTKKIIVLTRTGYIQIPFDGHGAKIQQTNGEEHFEFTQDGVSKELTFSNGVPEISGIEE